MGIEELEAKITLDGKSISEIVEELKDYLNNISGIRYEVTIVEDDNENLAKD